MEKTGKRPTNQKVGSLRVDIYEEDFDVYISQGIDLETIYRISVALQDYLEDLAETLDKPANVMLQ